MRWLITLSTLICVSANANWFPQGVYGKDHRQDMFEVEDPEVRQLSKSTMAVFSAQDLHKTSNGYKIASSPLGEYYELCPEEKFFHQPAAAFCSATLIAPTIVLTAGHCVEPKDCNDTRFVFDFQYDVPHREVTMTDASKIYSCKKIIHRKSDYYLDFALVQLDRPVQDRSPAKLASANIKVGEKLFMLGHPDGLPLKYSGEGMIHEQSPDFFYAYIDSFSGNSGSAVFSMQSKEIVGILARGVEDFYKDKRRNCYKVYDCKKNKCYGEEITNIEPVLRLLGRLH